MRTAPRKIRRRRSGELSIEQTHDAGLITALLRTAFMPVPTAYQGVECFLVAYSGDDPVGIAGLETEVDAALITALFVVENMRCRGVGAGLVSAVRLAAHTRGARILYAAVPTTCLHYFARLGFEETAPGELNKAFSGTMLQHIGLCNSPRCTEIRVDISRDGLIER